MAAKTSTTADLAWLVDDLVNRIAEAKQAVVLSADGLLIAGSRDFDREDAEHLAAVAAALQSLARGVGTRFNGGGVRQTIIEMDSAFLFVIAAGRGACLAVLGTADADVGLIAYEMATLVARAGDYLAAPSRSDVATAGDA